MSSNKVKEWIQYRWNSSIESMSTWDRIVDLWVQFECSLAYSVITRIVLILGGSVLILSLVDYSFSQRDFQDFDYALNGTTIKVENKSIVEEWISLSNRKTIEVWKFAIYEKDSKAPDYSITYNKNERTLLLVPVSHPSLTAKINPNFYDIIGNIKYDKYRNYLLSNAIEKSGVSSK